MKVISNTIISKICIDCGIVTKSQTVIVGGKDRPTITTIWKCKSCVEIDPDTYKYRKRARKALCDAVNSGELKRLPCEVCGDLSTEGHHESYEKGKWLDVNWLCQRHHQQLHKKRKVHT